MVKVSIALLLCYRCRDFCGKRLCCTAFVLQLKRFYGKSFRCTAFVHGLFDGVKDTNSTSWSPPGQSFSSLLLKANLENRSFILCCLSSEEPFPFLFLDKPLALHPNFLVAGGFFFDSCIGFVCLETDSVCATYSSDIVCIS